MKVVYIYKPLCQIKIRNKLMRDNYKELLCNIFHTLFFCFLLRVQSSNNANHPELIFPRTHALVCLCILEENRTKLVIVFVWHKLRRGLEDPNGTSFTKLMGFVA
jgi:hypothetical protein